MSRIIMLVPLDEDVGLTAISLGLISLFNQNKFTYNSKKSILYLSFIKNFLDDTSLIFNKYFLKYVDVFNNIDFSNKIFNSVEYFSLINKIIEECYDKKNIYKLILIQGVNKKQSIYSNEINYDISQNLSAEVIFIANLKEDSFQCAKVKESEIKIFLEHKKYKNVLGVIFNNINSPFIEKKYDFFKKLIILKNIKKNINCPIITRKFFDKKCFLTIACIPWNKNLLKTNVMDIGNFLSIKLVNLKNTAVYMIKKIIIFDENHAHYFLYKNYSNSFIIVPFSRIDAFMKIFFLNFSQYKISGIVFTEVLKSQKYMIILCQLLIKKRIPLFCTKISTTKIIYKLQNFNFDIHAKSKEYIKKLQKYVTNFFDLFSILSFKKNINHQSNYSPKEFCYMLKTLSRESNKRIILPESYESRILEAAAICYNSNIAKCILLGDPKKIHEIASDKGIKLSKKIEILNPDLIRNNYINRFIELRKKNSVDKFSAIKQLKNNTVLATLLLDSNEVDGLVSGAINTTADTIRPALQLIKTSPGNSLVSSVFLMLFPDQVLIYGDCAINIDPTAEELAEIAIQSANSAKMFRIIPRIAMLSYSTNCSGFGYPVEKVRHATNIIQKRRPDLIIDGPIQYDAAVSRTVSKLKNPYSKLLGAATVFIFPDLNSGNITYKAVQRSVNLLSIGPMLQGLRKPVNDLSRGASVEDIIYTIALTSIQSTQTSLL